MDVAHDVVSDSEEDEASNGKYKIIEHSTDRENLNHE